MKIGFFFKFFRVVIVIALALTIAVFLFKMKPKAERQVKPKIRPYVELMRVNPEIRNMIIEGYGTVRPSDSRKLVAEVRGKIIMTAHSFKEGGYFQKGNTLLKIDPRSYELEIQRQRIQIMQIDAELKYLGQEVRNLDASINLSESYVKLSLAEHKRLKELAKGNVAAQTNIDQAEQKYLSSLDSLQRLKNQMALIAPQKEKLQAQRAMAQVALSQAQLDFEKTTIIAPFDGWVLEKRVEMDEHVNTGQLLGSIYSKGELEVEINIPLKELKWFPHDLTLKNMPHVEIFMKSGGTLHRWNGRVARLKAQMDEKTRTLPAVVEINGAKADGEKGQAFNLRPGMFVTVRVKGIDTGEVFVLPRHLVHEGDVVYTVDGDRLRIKKVSVLRRHEDSVYIDKGLSDGDFVVRTPLTHASEGMLLRTND